MRTYVSTLGYDSKRVTRPVLSNGLDTNDELVLLRPQTDGEDTRAQQAITDVEQLVAQIEPNVSVSVEAVPYDDFAAAVRRCSDVLQSADRTLVVNLGGGARDVFLPFATAALAHTDAIDTVLSFSDIDGEVRPLQLPALIASIPSNMWNTLRAVDQLGGTASIPVLTDERDVAKSTVTRHVTTLEDIGAVTTRYEGKTKHIELTLTGDLHLRARKTVDG
jgi:CRISPR-associated protein Csa3